MNLVSFFTLLATCGILLAGYKVYLFESSKTLNRAFFALTILLFILSFSIYEMSQTTDYDTAMKFRKGLSIWPIVDCLIVFCLWRFSGIYQQVKSWKLYLISGTMGGISLVIMYLEFFPETMHAQLVLNEQGQWAWIIENFTWLDALRGCWLYMVCYAGILFCYLVYKKSKDRKRKTLLRLVFWIVFFGLNSSIVQTWMLPALGIPTSINQTFSSFFGIVFYAWVFTDFKLFEIKSTIAIENIVNSMTNLMVLTNEYFQIQEINPATERFFGIMERDFIDKSVISLVHNIDWKYYEKELLQMDFQTDQFSKELSVSVGDKTFYLILTVSPIINAHHIKTGYAFIGTDVTAQKQAEQKMQVYNAALKKSNEDLERFAYITSHDLKEPLRNIGSFASLLERKLKPEGEVKEYISFIMDGIERMNKLIESVFEISTLSKKEIRLMDIPVEELMRDIEENFQSIYPKNKLDIQYKNLPTIKGDKNQMYLLFHHLLENAIKYNQHTYPTVEVSCYNKNSYYEFSIKDNGIGIAPDFHQQIFTMFKRLHNQTTFQGTGIGLAICSKIIDFHHGKIWVESTEGEGSDFRFTIPI